MPKFTPPNPENPLGVAFFSRPAAVVAKALLGCIICRRFEAADGSIAFIRAVIVETEAYTDPQDQASHARNSLRTARNEPMWMQPCTAYVYFTYGMHYCLNVSCLRAGHPAAVLLRAARVIEGHSLVRAARAIGRSTNSKASSKPLADVALLRGPACLCKGLGVDGAWSGRDLLAAGGGLWLEPGQTPRSADIKKGPRVGLGKAAADKKPGNTDWIREPLRFWIKDEACVSGPLGRHQV